MNTIIKLLFITGTTFFIVSSSWSQEIPTEWKKQPNTALYKGANWKNEVKRVSNITLDQAFEIAKSNARIDYFFYMRSGMYLEGKSGSSGYTAKGSFPAQQAVFFSGKPWLGNAPMADTYIKVKPLVEIVEQEHSTLLKFSNINFEINNTNIINNSEKVLDDLTNYLKKNKSVNIQITGHTDNQGNKKLNKQLSKQRADKIKDLILERGISRNRITTVGYGSSYPVGDNKTRDGRAKNRRIEFRIPKNLIVNGGFESPQLSSNTWKSLKEVKGWQEKNGLPMELQHKVAGQPIEGNQFMEMDANKSTSIIQTVATNKNQVYILSFNFSARPNTKAEDNIIEVLWNRKILGTFKTKQNDHCIWKTYQFKVIGSKDSSKLEFRDKGISNSYGSYIDNVYLYSELYLADK